MRRWRVGSRLRRDDGGFSLVEVIVAATVFATMTTISTGVMIRSAGTGRAANVRTVASSTLGAAMEAVRGQDPLDIPLGTSTVTNTVDGVTYTTTTTSSWVADSATGDLCTSAGSSVRYKRIQVTVSFPAESGGTTTLTSSTLRALAGSSASDTTGSLALRITDVAGTAALSGVVTLTGAGSYSQQTDSTGCALFTGLAPGAYQAVTSVAGRVAADTSETASAGSIAVTAGSLTRGSLVLETPHSLSLSRSTGSTPLPSGLNFVLSGNGIAATKLSTCSGTVTFACVSAGGGGVQHLFADNYSVQAGICTNSVISAASIDLRSVASSALTLPMSTVNVVVKKLGPATPITDGRTITFTRSYALCPFGAEVVTGTASAATSSYSLPYGTWTVAVPYYAASTGLTTKTSQLTITSAVTSAVTLTFYVSS